MFLSFNKTRDIQTKYSENQKEECRVFNCLLEASQIKQEAAALRVLITTVDICAVIPHRNLPAYCTGYFATDELFTQNSFRYVLTTVQ